MRIRFFLFFSLVTQFLTSQEATLNDYYLALQKFDFPTAEKLSSDLDKEVALPYFNYITKFREGSGQSRNKDREIFCKILNSQVQDSLVHNLALGTYCLYNNPTNENTFLYLKEALVKAESIKEPTLTKLILQTVLEMHAKEMVQSSEAYYEYINNYKSLSTNIFDEFWTHFHTVKYYSKITNGDLNLIYEEQSIFENFWKKNKFNTNLNCYFFYFKALTNRIANNTEIAVDNYEKVIRLSKDYKHLHYLRFTSYMHLVQLYSDKKDYAQSKEKLNLAKENWDKSDSVRSRFIQNRFAAINYFEKIKRFDSSYYLLKESIVDGQLLDYRNNTLKINEMNVNLQTAQKEKQILEEQALKKRNQNIAIGLGGSLVLLTIIGTLLYRNTKRKQRIAEQEKELQIQKTTTVLKEQEINTINAMVEGQEKERLRIARDLHDNLGGTLAAVKMHIGNLQLNLETSKNPKELLGKANELISEAYTNVRSIAHERNSGVIAKQGLLPAIQKLASTISTSGGLHIEVHDFGLEERLSNHLEITIFRIVQELVTNVIKHANASELQISLTQHEKELNIVVEDNGNGFVVGKLQEKDGMGLGSIERRVEHLEGTMLVDSTLEKGTNIIIDIPL